MVAASDASTLTSAKAVTSLPRCLLAPYVGAWAVLAATICSNPRAPVPETQHVIPHNCHRMTVFISNVQDSLLHWLFPVFVLLSLITVAMALLAVMKVRISAQVQINDTEGSSPDSDMRRH